MAKNATARKPAAKTTATATAVDSGPYMNDERIAEFRAVLDAMLKDCETEAREAMHSLMEEDERPSDDVDRCDLNLRREEKRHLADRLVRRRAEIEAALRRLDGGEYGYCEETGDEIGLARLHANPLARLCIEAATRHEHLDRLRG